MRAALELLIATPLLLFCLGLWAPIPDTGQDRAAKLRGFAVIFGAGLLADYFLLLTLPLSIAVTGAALLGAFLLALSLVSMRRRGRIASLFRLGRGVWIAIAVTLVFTYARMVLEPIADWDARSIWYFHGKILYYSGGIRDNGSWHGELVSYLHLDYPKLISATAAQAAWIVGFWNEFLPKANLLGVLLPGFFLLLSFMRRPWSGAFLFCFLYLNMGDWLWNGYVDGYVALYFALLCLCGAELLAAANESVVLVMITFVGILLGLKNEGALASVCVLACLAGARLLAGGVRVDRGLVRRVLPALLAPLATYGAWQYRKHTLGLTNDLKLGEGAFARIAARLESRSALNQIARAFFLESTLPKFAALLAIVLGAARRLGLSLKGEPMARTWFCVACAATYFAGLLFIYLETPFGLDFHLVTVDRTLLAVKFALIAAAFRALEDVEAREPFACTVAR